MAGEYVFNLQNVTKHHEKKVILDDVNLAFFHGAHIGVIGANGAGKSSLLRILAGLDKDYMGTCYVGKNTKVGYLPQEPELDPEKTVQECVMEGVAEAQAMLEKYEDLCCRLDEQLNIKPTAEIIYTGLGLMEIPCTVGFHRVQSTIF